MCIFILAAKILNKFKNNKNDHDNFHCICAVKFNPTRLEFLFQCLQSFVNFGYPFFDGFTDVCIVGDLGNVVVSLVVRKNFFDVMQLCYRFVASQLSSQAIGSSELVRLELITFTDNLLALERLFIVSDKDGLVAVQQVMKLVYYFQLLLLQFREILERLGRYRRD